MDSGGVTVDGGGGVVVVVCVIVVDGGGGGVVVVVVVVVVVCVIVVVCGDGVGGCPEDVGCSLFVVPYRYHHIKTVISTPTTSAHPASVPIHFILA